MGQTVSVIVSAEDRERLAAIIGDRNRLQKHVQRARIVLLSADWLPAAEIARQAGVSRPSIWPDPRPRPDPAPSTGPSPACR